MKDRLISLEELEGMVKDDPLDQEAYDHAIDIFVEAADKYSRQYMTACYFALLAYEITKQRNKEPYTAGVETYKNEWPIPPGTKLGKRPTQKTEEK